LLPTRTWFLLRTECPRKVAMLLSGDPWPSCQLVRQGKSRMADVALNPIVQRLRQLESQRHSLNEQPAARILRWGPDDESVLMIQGLVDLQSEPASETPDLFIESKARSGRPAAYASTISGSLRAMQDANRERLLPTGSTPAGSVRSAKPPATFPDMVCFLGAVRARLLTLTGHLAIVLWPERTPLGSHWER
jgi:hypothetical protein